MNFNMSTEVIDAFFEKEKSGDDLDSNYLFYLKHKKNFFSCSKHSRAHSRKMFFMKEKNNIHLARKGHPYFFPFDFAYEYAEKHKYDFLNNNHSVKSIKAKDYYIDFTFIKNHIYCVEIYNNFEVERYYIEFKSTLKNHIHFYFYKSLEAVDTNDNFLCVFSNVLSKKKKYFIYYKKHYKPSNQFYKRLSNKYIRHTHNLDNDGNEIAYKKGKFYKREYVNRSWEKDWCCYNES